MGKAKQAMAQLQHRMTGSRVETWEQIMETWEQSGDLGAEWRTGSGERRTGNREWKSGSRVENWEPQLQRPCENHNTGAGH